MNPRVSVNICCYNSEKFIKNCLDSLFAQTYQNFQTILIDNLSPDCSLEIVRNNFPSVKVIKNQSNLGYCKAVNQGIRLAGSPYVAALNFDIVLDKYFLENLMKTIKSDPRIGSVTGKLVKLIDGRKTDLLDTTGHIIEHTRTAKNRGEFEVDRGQYDGAREIWGVCGAAPVYRKEMLEDIRFENEYLDKDLITGLDDTDIDWRARLLGWKSYYEPCAVAYHKRGGSITRFSFRPNRIS